MRHLHLDLVGGIAGDMFIAALLDCQPEFEPELKRVIQQAGFTDLVNLELVPFNDGVITGKRFKVSPTQDESHHHHHRHFSEIRKIISESELEQEVQDISLGIFQIIAEAEAQIHDKTVDEVAFHEVGAWDSIADVLCSSFLIHRLGITTASCSALPLGGGQVKTAHGMLPVPAPATALILKGFSFVDDGISGERITPTGAAILKYLNPEAQPAGKLTQQGFGFGTKKMPGISNTLRALLIEPAINERSQWITEQIHQLEFEIDDQTPEQLANSIIALQQLEGVIDVVQYSAVGKKNRLCHSIRLLAKSNLIGAVTECFRTTTTLGIRHTTVERYVLEREHLTVARDGSDYRVKVAMRPGGVTRKVEMDDLERGLSTAQQAVIRAEIETASGDEGSS